MNILLDDYCNLNCPYCFAHLNKDDRHNMSQESLDTILAFMERSHDFNAKFLGGEPTLHPKYTNIVNYVANKPFIKHITTFTNAVYLDRKKTKELKSREKISFVVNFNPKSVIGEEAFDNMVKNVRYLTYYLRDGGNEDGVTLSYTFYPGYEDYKYVIDYAMNFGLKKIRYSVGINNKEDGYFGEDYLKLKPAILNFARDCYHNGLDAGSDCSQPPLCLFTKNEILELMSMRNSLVFKKSCGPCMDVNYKLEVIRCFPTKPYGTVNLLDFKNGQELRNWFVENVDKKMKEKNLLMTCKKCQNLELDRCNGCLNIHNREK